MLGPRIAQLWARRAGGRGEDLVPHLRSLTRYGVAAILIAILLNLDRWRPLGAIILGIALATAASLVVWRIVRGLAMPRGVAACSPSRPSCHCWPRAVGGLEPIEDIFDRIGFSVSKHRISLLTAIEFAVIVVPSMRW